MTGRISGRLAFLEAARPSSPAGIAVVPYDAGEHGPEHLAQAIEAAQIARKGLCCTNELTVRVPLSPDSFILRLR